ncbi:universal stress protein [Streptomyces sp. NBRC 110028]|uniref:universal stress protein n=1 Tax=Streptomyces sp. NBRC 110028 TaxID=1621260 RepID=UPI00131BB490|nr:universal stress protein [Streptomyces sp. NBRC 110028]
MADRQLAAQRRIVVGVDGSFGAAQAFAWAAEQARDRHAVLDAVAAWEELGHGEGRPAPARGGQLAVTRDRWDDRPTRRP